MDGRKEQKMIGGGINGGGGRRAERNATALAWAGKCIVIAEKKERERGRRDAVRFS